MSTTTYTEMHSEGHRSYEMMRLIGERQEEPVYVAADDDGSELYRFADGTEVIVTNAGVWPDDADGFAEVRAGIVGPPE